MFKRFVTFILLIFHVFVNANSFDALLIKQETVIEVNKKSLIKDHYFKIRVNNRNGDEYGKISIPYSKLSRISKINAVIKNSKGEVVRKLKKNQITERSSISDISFYEDDFVKEFTLKHNIYPYTIEYSYRVEEDEYLFVDYWVPVLDANVPTIEANLFVSVPDKYQFSFHNNKVGEPKVNSENNVTTYSWNTNYADIVESETFSPPLINFLPGVAIVPDEFNFEKKGSFRSWSDFGDWHYQILQESNDLPDFEKNKISDMLTGVTDVKEKIKVLYHYLQDETRYINVSIQTGGLKPYPASYVAQNKYGDCKALTNYFKSMLEYIGVKSYYSKVYAGSPKKKIKRQFPSQQFNHIILFVPMEKDTIWLDCTSDGAFNSLGTFSQDRGAFKIDKDLSEFIWTPALNKLDVMESRSIEIDYSLNGQSEVIFQNSYKGEKYEVLLDLLKDYNNSDISRIFRNYILEEGLELVDYTINETERDSACIKISCRSVSKSVFQQFGNDILVRNFPFSLPDIEKPEKRDLPVQIDYPICKTDTIEYCIPKGFNRNWNIESQNIKDRFGSYKVDIIEEKDSIKIIKYLLVQKGTYPISEYNEFYDFVSTISELENKTILTLTK